MHQRLHTIESLRRILAAVVFSGAAVVVVLSIPLVSNSLTRALEIYPALDAAELDAVAKDRSTAIVILSAGRREYAPEFGGATVDQYSLERIRYGAAVARLTQLPVLVSGGLSAGEERPLAELMADVLVRDYGITAKWQETRSSTTAENAIYSAEILKRAGIGRVLLVTHASHMPRARAAFLANGISVIAAPTGLHGSPRASWRALIPSISAFYQSGLDIHEIIGIEWYSIRYGY